MFKLQSVGGIATSLPIVSQGTVEVPGVIDGKQTYMFYEPICASLESDPRQELYHLTMLLDGVVRSQERYCFFKPLNL